MDSSMKRKFILQTSSQISDDYINRSASGVNVQIENISIGLNDEELLLKDENDSTLKKIRLDLSDDFKLLNDDVKTEPENVTIGGNYETENTEVKEIDYLELDSDLGDIEEDLMEREIKKEDIDDKPDWLKDNSVPKGIMEENITELRIKEEKMDAMLDLLDDKFVSSGIMEEDIIEHEIKEEDVDDKPDWLQDDTVPKGWKRRVFLGIGSGISKYNIPCLLSPCGRQFRSRLLALEWMIRNNAKLEELEEIVSSLVHEGWESNSLLPEGWKFRMNRSAQQNKQTFQFLDNNFKLIKNVKEANEQLIKNFSIEDIDRLKMFMEILAIERRMENYTWDESCTVPGGWKVRIAEGKTGKTFYLSPDGLQFSSRCQGLQNMIKTSSSPEAVEEMKNSMIEYEDWEENQSLPNGWLIRETIISKALYFLTREGIILESFLSAIEYLKSNQYNKVDIERIEYLMNSKGVERRLDNYKWEESNSVPQGWKMRFAEGKGGKQYYLSPDGVCFSSRCQGLQYMIRGSYTESEIEVMRQLLIHENWQQSTLLPPDWCYKNSVDKIMFLSKSGAVFKSFLSAVKFAESCDRNEVTEDDLENMKLFLEDISTNRRITGYDWVNDKDLPSGWKIRTADGNGKKTFILSPSGKQFVCRRNALNFMVANNLPEEEVEKMRNDLKKDGWQDDRLIPKKWKYKRARETNKDVYFLDKTGKRLHGFKAVKDCLVSNPTEFNQKEVTNFEIFCELESIRRTVNSYKWNKRDKTVPEGWMSRVAEGVKGTMFFLSPDGAQFSSRKLAFQHLIKNSHDDDEVREMRSYLQHEGWEFHDQLPNFWMYWEAARFNSGISVNCKILTDDGQLFESFVTAVEFLKSSINYTTNDVINIQTFMKEKSNVRRQTLDVWESEKDLPDGWKSRVVNGCNTTKRNFMSPNGTQCYSERKALQQMVRENYDQKQIRKMRCYMKKCDWEENKYLPEGWMIRNGLIKKGSFRNMIISSEGESFHSYLAVVEHMKSNIKYTSKDINLIRSVMNEKAKERNEKNEKWTEDKILPNGWRSRLMDGKLIRKIFMAPNGDQFIGGRAALLHMIQEKYEEAETDKMRLEMSCEGWEQSEKLPIGWIIKETASNNKGKISSNCKIITDDGQVHESFSSAIEAMIYSNRFDEEDVSRIRQFMAEKSTVRRQTLENWEDDKNLPNGWRFRIAEGVRGVMFFLAPDGKQFQTRRAAYQHLIKETYSPTDVEVMKELLVSHEKWQENPNLPRGWIFKENSATAFEKHKSRVLYGYNFLTPEGDYFEGSNKPIEYIKSSTLYSNSDLEKFQQFIPGRQALRRKSNDDWEDDKNLPEGWKFKISGAAGKLYLLAPDGKQLQGRKIAYQHLIKDNYYKKDVEAMKSLLIQFEKWKEHPKLPLGWIFKENIANTQNQGKKYGYNYITTEGDCFEGTNGVKDYMRSSTLYSNSDFERLKEFTQERKVLRQIYNEDWEDDKNLPEGWRFKISGNTGNNSGKIYLLAPEGKQFQGRKVAYQHLIKEKYSLQDVEVMKGLLIQFEKWQEDSKLPNGWIFKEKAANAFDNGKKRVLYGYNYITAEGDYFKGSIRTIEYLKSSDLYSDSDLEKFRQFIPERQASRRKSMDDWEADGNLPVGWRFKISGMTVNKPGKLFYLTPDGKQIQGRKSALLHLIKGNFEINEVNKMKDVLIQYEKWETNSNLPEGWIFRETSNYGKDRGVERTMYSYSFVSKEGECLDSASSAIEFVKYRPDYDQVDVENFCKLVPERQAARRVNTEGWMEDNSLPDRWKYKVGEGKENRKSYLNPHGRCYQNRRSALQHMISDGYSESDVNRMRKGLTEEGWTDHDYLPHNWKYKITASTLRPSLRILTENGDVFDNFRSAKGYYGKKDIFNSEQFYYFEKYVSKKLKIKQNLTVPKGWKPDAGNDEEKFSILAPDGTKFVSRQAAVMSMIIGSFCDDDLVEMKKCLNHEGWKEKSGLPEGWKSKIADDSISIFLSPDSDILESFEEAKDYLMANSVNKEIFLEDIKKLTDFLKEKISVPVQEKSLKKSEWTDSETVPAGWKVKKSNPKVIQAPDGTQFTSKKSAIHFMVKEGWRLEDLQAMRSKLSFDGWNLDTRLPTGWAMLLKRNKDCIQYITPSGEEVMSTKAAVQYLKENQGTEEDIQIISSLSKRNYSVS